MSTAPTAEPKQVPRTAFAIHAADPLAFRDSAGDERATPERHPVTVFARTGDVVDHWFWGRIVHDMQGMRHKDRIPFDWRHDPDQSLGYADAIEANDDGLKLAGVLISIDEGDRASQVIRRGRLGQPYEASFYWDERDPVLEYLDEGFIAEVNGRTIAGPCVIVREWTLRGCAITPHGVDQSTATQFSAAGSTAAVPVSFRPAKGATMTKDANPNPAPVSEATAPTAVAPTKDSANPAGEPNKPAKAEPGKPSIDPDATRDAARGELSRYMQRFGNQRGAEYFRDSVPYQSALEKEVDHLRKEAATKDEALQEANRKLEGINLGEADPVEAGANKDAGKASGSWEGLFRKQGS